MTRTDSTLPIGDLRLLHDFIIPSSWQIVPGRIKSAVGIGALLLDGLGQDARGTKGSESEPTKTIKKPDENEHAILIYSARMNKIWQQLESFFGPKQNITFITWLTCIYSSHAALGTQMKCLAKVILFVSLWPKILSLRPNPAWRYEVQRYGKFLDWLLAPKSERYMKL